jgi:hypothetical protein
MSSSGELPTFWMISVLSDMLCELDERAFHAHAGAVLVFGAPQVAAAAAVQSPR